jgi:outer membrane protein assembly factor BamB
VDLSAEAEQNLGDVPEYLDADTTPVPATLATGPAVFVGAYEGGVFALDAETGSQIWANPAVLGVTELLLWQQAEHAPRAGSGPHAPARSILLAATGTTGFWGLEPETGDKIWHRDLPDGGVARPTPMAGALLVPTTRHGLFLVSVLDGGVIDGVHSGVGFSMPAAAFGRRAFILTNGGRLLSFSLVPPV